MDRRVVALALVPALALVVLHAASCGATLDVPGALDPSDAVAKVPSFDEESFTAADLSTEVSFVDLLGKAGAMGIVSSKGFVDDRILSAVTADGMRYIYMFEDGRYSRRLEILCDGDGRPVNPFVKVVQAKDRSGVILFAENLAFEGKRIAQIILVGKEGDKTYVNLAVDMLEKEHGGMVDPYVGGVDLESGLIFSAKNSEGKAWKSIFVITGSDDSLEVVRMSRYLGASCAGFMDWVHGEDARDVFGMRI